MQTPFFVKSLVCRLRVNANSFGSVSFHTSDRIPDVSIKKKQKKIQNGQSNTNNKEEV